MPEGYAIQAIQAVLSGQRAYCKFLAANDTGLTGGHQAGIYISKPSIPILFDEPGISCCPDTENTFPSCIRAMEYALEEGLPVWVVKDGSNYPLDVFTYHKLEVLFDL